MKKLIVANILNNNNFIQSTIKMRKLTIQNLSYKIFKKEYYTTQLSNLHNTSINSNRQRQNSTQLQYLVLQDLFLQHGPINYYYFM